MEWQDINNTARLKTKKTKNNISISKEYSYNNNYLYTY